MIEFNQANFNQEGIKSTAPVLIDFWAPWCGPCRMVAPVIDEIAAEYSDKLKIGKVNVDDNQELAEQYGVMSIPTICLFVKGAPVMKLVGFRPKKEIVAEINKNLAG